MYRKPGDLKWRGRRPKQQRRTMRGSWYRYPHGEYFRWIKKHHYRAERQETRLALIRGEEPFPHRNSNNSRWDWL